MASLKDDPTKLARYEAWLMERCDGRVIQVVSGDLVIPVPIVDVIRRGSESMLVSSECNPTLYDFTFPTFQIDIPCEIECIEKLESDVAGQQYAKGYSINPSSSIDWKTV